MIYSENDNYFPNAPPAVSRFYGFTVSIHRLTFGELVFKYLKHAVVTDLTDLLSSFFSPCYKLIAKKIYNKIYTNKFLFPFTCDCYRAVIFGF